MDSDKPSGRHRKPDRSDPVVVALRVGTLFAAAFVLVVGTLIVVDSDSPEVARPPDGDPPARTTTTVPSSTEPSTSAPTTTRRLPSSTTAIIRVPARPPVVTSTTTTRIPKEEPGPAVVGEPCPSRGEMGFTADYRPVVCYPDSDDELVWRRFY